MWPTSGFLKQIPLFYLKKSSGLYFHLPHDCRSCNVQDVQQNLGQGQKSTRCHLTGQKRVGKETSFPFSSNLWLHLKFLSTWHPPVPCLILRQSCAHVFHHREHLSSPLILMQQIFTLATKYLSGTNLQAKLPIQIHRWLLDHFM